MHNNGQSDTLYGAYSQFSGRNKMLTVILWVSARTHSPVVLSPEPGTHYAASSNKKQTHPKTTKETIPTCLSKQFDTQQQLNGIIY